MAAKYQVTVPPGAPVAGVGFVRHTEIFTAPKGYVPSYTMLPVNDEAVKELEKVKKALLAGAAELRKGVEGADVEPSEKKSARQYAAALEANAKGIVLEPIEVPSEAPKIEQGVPLSRLAERDAEPKAPGAHDAKGGRAADR
jgi:hypothetical protein